ncbi:hypothetical protein C2G38_2222083 [Gigaspora rosea]|uniref:Uncharacterized protein n=1 Tax=Gigaspora rosea TaxID=44941 RepID=A0A397UBN8_9GLOM|nr:hypothetical protein C2G38_2222083 [Gigaspora rosea]
MYNKWAEDILLIIELVLSTEWDIENKLPFIDIDSSGLKVSYTAIYFINNLLIKDPDDYKAVIVRANNPIPSECGIFYFEIKIINKGKNG